MAQAAGHLLADDPTLALALPNLCREVDDLSQEVLVVVFRELPSFERHRDGSFRAWLRQITVNRMYAFCKTQRKQPLALGGAEIDQLLAQLADPTSDLARQWDQDHDKHVFGKLLAIVEGDFEPTTWQAFTGFAVEGSAGGTGGRGIGRDGKRHRASQVPGSQALREEAGGLLD